MLVLKECNKYEKTNEKSVKICFFFTFFPYENDKTFFLMCYSAESTTCYSFENFDVKMFKLFYKYILQFKVNRLKTKKERKFDTLTHKTRIFDRMVFLPIYKYSFFGCFCFNCIFGCWLRVKKLKKAIKCVKQCGC